MQVTTISNFRKDSKKYFDQVIEARDILLITRTDGQTIVAMHLDDYNNLSKAGSAQQPDAHSSQQAGPANQRPPT